MDNKTLNETASSNEDTPTNTSSKKEAVLKEGDLKQQGDYSTLFEREPNNCDFINTESLARALGVSSELIANTNNNCTFQLTEANGEKTSFRFSIEPWSNQTILKEIKTAKENAETFGKDSKLSQYRISETGDTYLSMHQNRMIRILNERSQNVIVLFYSVQKRAAENELEKIANPKDVARERSYAIANYLLNTYKK